MNWYKNAKIISDLNSSYRLKTSSEDYKYDTWFNNAILEETNNWKKKLSISPAGLTLLREWLFQAKPDLNQLNNKENYPYLAFVLNKALDYWNIIATTSTDTSLLKFLSDVANKSRWSEKFYCLNRCFRNPYMPKEEIIRTLKNTKFSDIYTEVYESILANPSTPKEVLDNDNFTPQERNLLYKIKDIIYDNYRFETDITKFNCSVDLQEFNLQLCYDSDDSYEKYIMVEKISSDEYSMNIDNNRIQCDNFLCVMETIKDNIDHGSRSIQIIIRAYIRGE